MQIYLWISIYFVQSIKFQKLIYDHMRAFDDGQSQKMPFLTTICYAFYLSNGQPQDHIPHKILLASWLKTKGLRPHLKHVDAFILPYRFIGVCRHNYFDAESHSLDKRLALGLR